MKHLKWVWVVGAVMVSSGCMTYDHALETVTFKGTVMGTSGKGVEITHSQDIDICVDVFYRDRQNVGRWTYGDTYAQEDDGCIPFTSAQDGTFTFSQTVQFKGLIPFRTTDAYVKLRQKTGATRSTSSTSGGCDTYDRYAPSASPSAYPYNRGYSNVPSSSVDCGSFTAGTTRPVYRYFPAKHVYFKTDKSGKQLDPNTFDVELTF